MLYIFPTDVIARPVNPIAVALHNVTLSCVPVSRATARTAYRISRTTTKPQEYEWHRIGDDIPVHSSGEYSNLFVIHEITPIDAGTYYCIAVSYSHCALSNNITLKVDGKERISYHNHTVSCISVSYSLLAM